MTFEKRIFSAEKASTKKLFERSEGGFSCDIIFSAFKMEFSLLTKAIANCSCGILKSATNIIVNLLLLVLYTCKMCIDIIIARNVHKREHSLYVNFEGNLFSCQLYNTFKTVYLIMKKFNINSLNIEKMLSTKLNTAFLIGDCEFSSMQPNTKPIQVQRKESHLKLLRAPQTQPHCRCSTLNYFHTDDVTCETTILSPPAVEQLAASHCHSRGKQPSSSALVGTSSLMVMWPIMLLLLQCLHMSGEQITIHKIIFKIEVNDSPL